MSPFEAANDRALATLRHYTALLEGRKEALVRISDVSERLLSTLTADPTADVALLLEEREGECRRLAALPADSPAPYAGTVQTGEAAALARSVAVMQQDAQVLGDRILDCQARCEDIMRTRLEAISKAIRESGQRRRLDAVYGPACSHQTPTFLDRQR